MQFIVRGVAAVLACSLFSGVAARAAITAASDPILYWNDIAITGVLGSPPVQTRGYAILNIAMHDAVNAAVGRPSRSYLAGVAAPGGDPRAAASQAAYGVLVALNPGGQPGFQAALDASLAQIADGPAKTDGIATGTAYASAILANRTGDGSAAVVVHVPGGQPGDWQPTPPANAAAVLQQWGAVDPFLMTSGSQFRPAAPPSLGSAEYAAAYNEVQAIGAAGSVTRTLDQTASAVYWNAANGSNWLRIGLTIAEDEGLTTLGNAQVFARLATSLADSQIAGFDAKTTFDLWRPVTAIRLGDTDGNALTIGEPAWQPLNNAPAHQSYVSTLSSLSGAGATTLTAAFGDDEGFCMTIAANNRCFTGLAAAAQDAANSRLWGGIHYSFDSVAGLAIGVQAAQLALDSRTFAAVPEPAAWALMVVGFGLVGGALRKRKVQFVTN